MKLLYCLPSLTACGGTERVLTTRLNYLAENTDYTIYIVVTESQHSAPYFPLDPRVKVIELNIDFLQDRRFTDKFLNYHRRLRQYRRKLTQVIEDIKPDIVTSFLSHEIDFMTRLKDGSIKVGENHFNRNFRYSFVKNNTFNPMHRCVALYRNFRLGRLAGKLDALVSLTEDD